PGGTVAPLPPPPVTARLLASALVSVRCQGSLSGVLDHPGEGSLAPSVGKTESKDANEERHGGKTGEPEAPGGDRPRKQEDRLDVEQDEEHRDQIEVDRETLVGASRGVRARFVGARLGPRLAARTE